MPSSISFSILMSWKIETSKTVLRIAIPLALDDLLWTSMCRINELYFIERHCSLGSFYYNSIAHSNRRLVLL